jgi:hypothetical protein
MRGGLDFRRHYRPLSSGDDHRPHALEPSQSGQELLRILIESAMPASVGNRLSLARESGYDVL